MVKENVREERSGDWLHSLVADIKFGAKSRGSAEFSPGDWKMALSAASMDQAHISIEHFSILVENAVHETQHAVTNFRGLRMALALERFNPATVVPEIIVDAARAANAQQHPNRELDPQTRREALEIYRVSMDPTRATGEAVLHHGDSIAAMAEEIVSLRLISSSSKSVTVLPSSTRVRRFVAPAA